MIKTWQEGFRDTPVLRVNGYTRETLMIQEIDKLRAELAKLKAQEPFGSVVVTNKGEKLFYELTARPYLDNAQAYFSVYIAAGAQGHTREQIGLQLDDRREGLTAHHVYCRAVTEDV